MEPFNGLYGNAKIITVLIIIVRTVYGQNLRDFMLLEYPKFLKVFSFGVMFQRLFRTLSTQ